MKAAFIVWSKCGAASRLTPAVLCTTIPLCGNCISIGSTQQRNKQPGQMRHWQNERTFHCPCCLLSIDRDLKAALNTRAVGLHSTGLSLEAHGFCHGE